MIKRQPYRELSWVREALEYADSPECSKKVKKILRTFIIQAEAYREAMHKYQDTLDDIKVLASK